MSNYFSRPAVDISSDNAMNRTMSDPVEDNAIEDGVSTEKGLSAKSRNRRASEGSYMVQGEGKRVSGELRCDTCGKGYKHSSCLTKHMYVCRRLHFFVLG